MKMRTLLSAVLVAMVGLALSVTDAAAGGRRSGSKSGNYPKTIVCQIGQVLKYVGTSAKCVAESNAGDVKLVFVTSTKYQGDIAAPDCSSPKCDTGPGRADFECNRLAAAVGLPGEYTAWLSDSWSDAIDRLPDPGGPWFNLHGDLVAASKANLTALLDPGTGAYLYNPIPYTEMGTPPSNQPYVWTGTDTDGVVHVPVSSPYDQATCNDWTATAYPYSAVFGQAVTTADGVSYRWTGATPPFQS